MSVELACGKCQGRFLVVAPGTVVCPHCGTHLSVTAEAFSGQNDDGLLRDPSPPPTDDPPKSDTAAQEFEEFQNGAGRPGDASAEDVDDEQREGGSANQPAAVSDMADFQGVQDEQQGISVSDSPPVSVPLARSDVEAQTITVAEFNNSKNESLSADAPAVAFESSSPLFGESIAGKTGPDEFPEFNAPPGKTDAADIDALLENADNVTPNLREQPAFANEPLPVTDQPFPLPALTSGGTLKTVRRGVPTRWFIILASYASAMTIVCLWLLLKMMSGVHQLENLDDPVDAPVRGQKKVVRVYPINLQLPPGHELRIGDRRRYGHIVVEPLKVSRGRLEFVHFNGEQGTVKEPTAPVLKLWLRFENVSDDQTIAPLDSILLFSNRIRTEQNYEEFHANNFVVGRDVDKNSVGRLLHVYDMNTDEVWDLQDQQLGKKLKPGESCVIYVPTGAKGVDKMVGDLVWRLHFRKGYSPSNRGVTTLIDVKFNSRAIQNEASQPADQSTASR